MPAICAVSFDLFDWWSNRSCPLQPNFPPHDALATFCITISMNSCPLFWQFLTASVPLHALYPAPPGSYSTPPLPVQTHLTMPDMQCCSQTKKAHLKLYECTTTQSCPSAPSMRADFHNQVAGTTCSNLGLQAMRLMKSSTHQPITGQKLENWSGRIAMLFRTQD